jgi:hypothetical protein
MIAKARQDGPSYSFKVGDRVVMPSHPELRAGKIIRHWPDQSPDSWLIVFEGAPDRQTEADSRDLRPALKG